MHKWKSFSLRSSLLFVAAVCCLIAIHSARSRSAHRQERIVDKINASANTAYYDFELKSHDITTYPNTLVEWQWGATSTRNQPFIPGEPPVPDWLINQMGIDYFCSIGAVDIGRYYSPLQDTPTAAELAAIDQTNTDLLRSLSSLDQVEVLILDWTPPEALDSLKAMRGLERVTFRDTVEEGHLANVANSPARFVELQGAVDDEQLIALSKSRRITALKMPLRGTIEISTFTDEGVRAICKLTRLTSLTLRSPLVTDESAKYLTRMDKLVELELRLPQMADGLPGAIRGKSLRSLFICDMLIGELAFNAISELEALETLCIHSPVPANLCRLSRSSLISLAKLRNLRFLRLDGFVLSLSDMRTLLRNMPLRFLFVGGQVAAVDADAIVKEFPQLELVFKVDGYETWVRGQEVPTD